MSVLHSGSCRVRDDLAVEFDFDTAAGGSIAVHWCPRPPTKLSPTELALYRASRNRFLRRVAEQVGGAVLVLE